jgi:hypothetical protein
MGRQEVVGKPEPNALSRQFNDAAQLYDEVPPRSPQEMVAHGLCGIPLPWMDPLIS